MPNRILKESIKTSEEINRLSWFEEVVFERLIVTVDDYGCFDGRVIVLKNELFPTKDNVTRKAIEDAVEKLERVNLLTRYEVEGRPYIHLNTFEAHQRVRNQRRKYPEPPQKTCQSIDGQLSDNCQLESESNPIRIQSESETEPESKKGVFTPPTAEEVRAYCQERGNAVDPERFVDFYASKGWMVGRNRMKDWKACVRTWEKKETVQREVKPDIIPVYDDSQNPAFDPKRLQELLERKRM